MGKIDLNDAILPLSPALQTMPAVQGYAAHTAQARARAHGRSSRGADLLAVAYLVCLWAGAARLAGLFAARLDGAWPAHPPISQRIGLALEDRAMAIGPYGDLPFAPEALPDFAALLRRRNVPAQISAALTYCLAVLQGRAASADENAAQADAIAQIIGYAQRLILLGPARARPLRH
jgi:hypothetical protein